MSVLKKAPGRPAKKGKSTWKPASLNEFDNKEPGYRYRMSRKDPENLAKKEAEGWETVSNTNSPSTEHIDPGHTGSAKPLTSVLEGRDWVMQRIPEELAQERDAYYSEVTERRTAGLTAHMKKEIAKEGAETHGNITISSRTGTQVIE